MSELYATATSRAIDAWIINRALYSGYDLMCRAGGAAFRLWQVHFPEFNTAIVLVGPGNNGGDGLIIARLAKAQGYAVEVYAVAGPSAYRDDARLALTDWLNAGGKLQPFSADLAAPEKPCLLIDALLGSGLNKPVSGVFAQAVDWLNRSPWPVLAVDIPSGLNGDTGKVMGGAVKAAATVSFIARKQGLYTGDARDYTGRIYFVDLGLPTSIYEDFSASASLLGRPCFPPRSKGQHKGDNGHVWLIGGAPGFSGAARMAGEAALRVGAGRVSIATHPDHACWLNLDRPELMVHGLTDNVDLAELTGKADVIALGPGLGVHEFGRFWFEQALSLNKPLVIDADGLNLLAQTPHRRDDWILTPHPGEAARLLGCSIGQIEEDRFSSVRRLQQRYGGCVVLKGAGTLVADEKMIWVIETGNPGMATAGMGDILTGVIAALWAQGLSLSQSAAAGAYIHGAAGDQAARADGERGLIASDLLPYLREQVNHDLPA